MPAIIPGSYLIKFGLEFIDSESNSNLPPPKPLYLTNNGEGKQLTVEPGKAGAHNPNQEWNIVPPLKDEFLSDDSGDRVIIPALELSREILAVSQDVVKSPDEVALIKNLQVWSFEAVRESDNLYEIRSNLFAGRVGTIPLLGVDKEFQKAIIQFIPVILDPPPKPVWQLIGPLKK